MEINNSAKQLLVELLPFLIGLRLRSSDWRQFEGSGEPWWGFALEALISVAFLLAIRNNVD